MSTHSRPRTLGAIIGSLLLLVPQLHADPFLPPGLPTLDARPAPGGGVRLTLSNPATNVLWQLQFSTDLRNWTTIRGWTQNSGPDGAVLEWTNSTASGPVRFYCAVAVPTNWDAPTRVWGMAAGADPLAAATVSVLDLDGNLLFQEPDATSASGGFDVSVRGLPSAFVVLVSGGFFGRTPFAGTLERAVAKYDGQAYLVVNPVSTLLAAYQRLHPGLALDQAEAAVNQYLMAPPGEDLVDELSYGDYQYFDPGFYMAQAAGAGGFDAFTAQVAGGIQPGASLSFAPLKGFLFDAVLDFAKWGVKEVASGAAGAAGGSIFSMIFGSEHAETMLALADIKNQIAQVQEQLGKVYNTVVQIQQDLSNVSAQLHIMQWDEAIRAIYDPVTSIDSTFSQFWRKAQDAELSPTNASVQSYARDMTGNLGPILHPTTGIYKYMELLNNNILGLYGGTPLLEMRATNLEANVDVNVSTRGPSYVALRDFFAQLMGEETKGLSLVVQAYDGQGATNTANIYLAAFYTNNLAPQARLFERTVEEVVLRHLDTRWAEFLPEAGSSEMLAPAYEFADNLLNSYRVSVQNGSYSLATNDVTMLTVAIGYAGAPPSVDSVTLADTGTGQELVVPYEATVTVSADGGQLSLLRFHVENAPSGTYHLVKVGANLAAGRFSSIYANETVTVDANDPNTLYGVLCIPAWAPLASEFGKAIVQAYEISAPYSGNALEFAGASSVEGARVQQWDKTGLDNQKWYPEGGPSVVFGLRTYAWKNKYSGEYLTATSFLDSGSGLPVVQHRFQYSSESLQYWLWTGNSFMVTHSSGVQTRQYLSMSGNMAGAAAIQDRLTGPGVWGWEDAGAGYMYLRNKGSGKYLEVAGPSTEAEAHLQAMTWSGAANQKWFFVYAGDGYYAIANTYANTVMDLWAGNGEDGAPIKSNTWLNHNQLWRIDPLGDGSCRIISNTVGKAVTVEGASIQDGAQAYSWTWNGSSNQKWLLTPVN